MDTPPSPTPAEHTREATLVRAALVDILRFAATTPSDYQLGLAILTQGLRLPQECKGAYINGLAGLYMEKGPSPDVWLKFRSKLQAHLLKMQALVQSAEMLLRDWRIDAPSQKQFELAFPTTADTALAQTQAHYNAETGEVV